MMPPKTDDATAGLTAVDACWLRIGVQGDRSCPKLAQAVHCRNCPVFSAAGRHLFEREAPTEYLDECTRQLADVEEVAAGDVFSLLMFRIGPEWMALDAAAIVEVVEPRAIHRVPHRTNRLLLGLANIRGELQLCVSLRELLEIGSPDALASPEHGSSSRSRPRLLVVEHNQQRWVFPVDEVDGVHRVCTAAMQNLPDTVARSPRYCSQAVFAYAGRQVGMLAVTRLFEALERTVR